MMDKKLSEIGELTIHEDGEVGVEGFHADGCSCREVVCLALLHGIGILQKQLTETVAAPGGGNNYIN